VEKIKNINYMGFSGLEVRRLITFREGATHHDGTIPTCWAFPLFSAQLESKARQMIRPPNTKFKAGTITGIFNFTETENWIIKFLS
jgi:hypothetical protein